MVFLVSRLVFISAAATSAKLAGRRNKCCYDSLGGDLEKLLQVAKQPSRKTASKDASPEPGGSEGHQLVAGPVIFMAACLL